jgi:hypothetical protein
MLKGPNKEEFEARYFLFTHAGAPIQDVKRLGDIVSIHPVRSGGLGITCPGLLKKALQARRFHLVKGKLGYEYLGGWADSSPCFALPYCVA